MNVVDTVGIPLFTTSRHFTSPFEMARVAGGIFRKKANLTAEMSTELRSWTTRRDLLPQR